MSACLVILSEAPGNPIDIQPLATVQDLPFSHSDSSISRKSRPVTILKAAVYPWERWSEFLVVGCPSSHQSTRSREETLESRRTSSAEVEFPPPYLRTPLPHKLIFMVS